MRWPWRPSLTDQLVEATEVAMGEILRRVAELAQVSQVHKLTAEESLQSATRQRDRKKER